MKTLRFALSAVAMASVFFLAACKSGEDEENMMKGKGELDGGLNAPGPDLTGNGANSLGEGANGSGSGLNGAGANGSELSARNENWTPLTDKKFKPIYFAFDRYNIGTSQIPYLQGIGNYMKQNDGIGLIIEGNCDERGSAEYNMGLGERRAIAVRDFLVQMGIADSRFQTVSYGAERPANPGHDENAWAENRRDEMTPALMNGAPAPASTGAAGATDTTGADAAAEPAK